jgi:nucleoside-diphosphate-sugar epimerase
MHVIITGATSFIGKAVTKKLLSEGCSVTAVVRPDSPGRAQLERGGAAEVVCLDLAQIEQLAQKQFQTKPDAWIHLGWEGAGSANRSNPALQEKNIGYAMSALRTASALGCERFLFCGSQAEYGICNGPMREEMECHPVSEYGKDKLAVCLAAGEEAKRLRMTYIHARVFSVYGPGDHPWSLVSTCVDTFLKGGHMKLGPCTQQWNFLYIRDAAEALSKLLLAKVPAGVYNVAGEDTRPLRDYIEELYRLCGSRGTYEFGNRPPNAEGVVSLVPDLTKLHENTGFCQKVSFAEGIRETAAAWENAGKH